MLSAEAVCVLPEVGSGLGIAGVCEVPGLPVTYCERTGRFSDDDFLHCHRLPHSSTLTSSWFDGDCDGDGCPNGADPAACNPSVCAASPLRPERVCGRRLLDSLPERCTVVPDRGGGFVLSCATPHACDSSSPCPEPGFTCRAGVFEPIVCGSQYSCRDPSDCAAAGMGPAICVPSPDVFAPGADGFCGFTSYRTDGRCVGRIAECLTTPAGEPTLDFYAGDCDGDGCANGADDTVCAAGFSSCPLTMSPACGTVIGMPPDAGAEPDVATPDGAVPGLDAGAPLDPRPSPNVSIAGGSGCRCLVHRRTSTAVASLLGGVLAVIGLRRRARARR